MRSHPLGVVAIRNMTPNIDLEDPNINRVFGFYNEHLLAPYGYTDLWFVLWACGTGSIVRLFHLNLRTVHVPYGPARLGP